MRPKDLKFPLSWAQRRPLYLEGVLIVPKCYDNHDSWKDEEGLFSTSDPIHIEYCSGNGDWIIEKASRDPSTRWIAVEMDFSRVRKIWSKVRNRGIDNVMIVCGEALTFSKYYLREGIVQEVYVNFPDPWPKNKHAKHRLIQTPFATELARVVAKGGTVTFATDDPPYSQQMIETMRAQSTWEPTFQPPYYIQDWEGYGDSWFRTLWDKKGRTFFYMQFERR